MTAFQAISQAISKQAVTAFGAKQGLALMDSLLQSSIQDARHNPDSPLGGYDHLTESLCDLQKAVRVARGAVALSSPVDEKMATEIVFGAVDGTLKMAQEAGEVWAKLSGDAKTPQPNSPDSVVRSSKKMLRPFGETESIPDAFETAKEQDSTAVTLRNLARSVIPARQGWLAMAWLLESASRDSASPLASYPLLAKSIALTSQTIRDSLSYEGTVQFAEEASTGVMLQALDNVAAIQQKHGTVIVEGARKVVDFRNKIVQPVPAVA